MMRKTSGFLAAVFMAALLVLILPMTRSTVHAADECDDLFSDWLRASDAYIEWSDLWNAAILNYASTGNPSYLDDAGYDYGNVTYELDRMLDDEDAMKARRCI